jgi:hemoglobin-like flavoprotein
MLFKVTARSAPFGQITILTESPAEALSKARELEEDGCCVLIADPLGAEHDPDAFERLAGEVGLTPAQLDLVQGTCDVLLSANSRAADLFYDRLFALAPETRPLFAADLAAQKLKLNEMLVALVGHLADPHRFAALACRLGRSHAAYGARAEHYVPVGTALLASLETLLGDRFTPEVRAAWTALYVQVSRGMIAAQES